MFVCGGSTVDLNGIIVRLFCIGKDNGHETLINEKYVIIGDFTYYYTHYRVDEGLFEALLSATAHFAKRQSK